MPTKVSQSLDLDARVWATAQRLRLPTDSDLAATMARLLRRGMVEEAARLGFLEETLHDLYTLPGETLRGATVSITRFDGGLMPPTATEREAMATSTATKKVRAVAGRTGVGRHPKGGERRIAISVQLEPDALRILDGAATAEKISRSDILVGLLRRAALSNGFTGIADEILRKT